MGEYRIELSDKSKRDMLEIHTYIASNLEESSTVFVIRVLYARRDWLSLLLGAN